MAGLVKNCNDFVTTQPFAFVVREVVPPMPPRERKEQTDQHEVSCYFRERRHGIFLKRFFDFFFRELRR
jgi:hypothetical protein